MSCESMAEEAIGVVAISTAECLNDVENAVCRNEKRRKEREEQRWTRKR